MTTIDDITLESSPVLTMKGGPKFSVNVTKNKGGYRYAQGNWKYALWVVTLTFTDEQRNFQPIINFFLGQRGPEFPFLVKDPSDHADGGYGKVELVGSVYRLTKTYPHLLRPYQRLITRPIEGTITWSGVNGTPVLDYETGIFTGVSSLEDDASWEGEFKVPMAFTSEDLIYDYDAAGIKSVSCDLEEVRV